MQGYNLQGYLGYLQGYLLQGLPSSGLTFFRATLAIFRAYLGYLQGYNLQGYLQGYLGYLQGLPSSGLTFFRATIFRATLAIFRATLATLGLPSGLPSGLPWLALTYLHTPKHFKTCIPQHIKYTPKHFNTQKNLHTSVDCAIIYTCVANTSHTTLYIRILYT